jgi:hypothetical protein
MRSLLALSLLSVDDCCEVHNKNPHPPTALSLIRAPKLDPRPYVHSSNTFKVIIRHSTDYLRCGAREITKPRSFGLPTRARGRTHSESIQTRVRTVSLALWQQLVTMHSYVLRSPYDILDIDELATPEEIKRKYRQLSLCECSPSLFRCHP